MVAIYVLPLDDERATLEVVGGKGMSLARLSRAGLPVPGGFHITTQAYRRFVAENGLQPHILEAIQGADISIPDSLEAASRQIATAFTQGTIPAEIAQEISQAYRALRPQPGLATHCSVAVRSSATAEDLPEASFAGQQDTYLNIQGVPAVLEAVKKCWASLWTARAIAYRSRQGIDPGTVALAVVIQELVFADVAGVMFTANPLNGKRSETTVTATWGLGEAIVSGVVTPDTLVVDKTTNRILHRQTAEKQIMTLRTETGTAERAVPAAQQRKEVLSDSQAAELARLGTQIEGLYHMPMDIEWALVLTPPDGKGNGEFAIVQARPITALPPDSSENVEPPLEWPIPHPKAVLARGSFAEFVPEPVSPLFATLAVPIAHRATNQLMHSMGVSDEDSYILAVINGYVYVGVKLTPKMGLQMIWGSLAILKVAYRTARQRAEASREKCVAAVAKWQTPALGQCRPSELLAGVREIFGATAEYYTMVQSGTIPLAMTGEILFGKFYQALIKRHGDPDASSFVFGAENQALRGEKALFDLAGWAKTRPELAAYLADTPAEALWTSLQNGLTPVAGWEEFATRFQAHLREYGHAIYDLDFAKPTMAEAPLPLLEAVKIYLAGKNNPYERQQAAIKHRERAAEGISKRLDPLRRKWFLKLLHWAQETAPLREDSIADLGVGHQQIRRMLEEVGRRLTAGGALEAAPDIYWLEASELDALVGQLEKGEPLSSFVPTLQERRARGQALRRISPPPALPPKSWMARFYPSDTQADNVIKGFAASAGKVTAPACVMRGPEDFGKLQPGDVIVAGITTPAWTPLFARAAAIVTDIGGPLSHSSIVAREYGIPAVLATVSGTRRIQPGQVITVDGSAGTVTLHPVQSQHPQVPGPQPGNAALPIEWKPPNPKGMYMRGSVADLMPAPLSPLFITLGMPALRTQMVPVGLRLLHSKPVLQPDYFTTVNAYAYMNAAMSFKGWWWALVRMLPAYPRLLSRLVPAWRHELHPEYQAKVASYQSKVPAAMPAGELWGDIQGLVDAATYYVCGLMFATMGASAGSEMLLEKVYQKTVKQEGDPAVAALLSGWDSIPVKAEKSLYDLAQWSRQQPGLSEYLLATPGTDLARALVAPPPLAPASFAEFASRLAEHQRRFGHIIFQLDFAADLPLDHPELMLENIRLYLRGEAANPHARQQASQEKRTHLAEELRQRGGGLKRWAFRKALGWAQSLSEVREDALAEIGLAYPLLRAMLVELGRRLAQAGALGKATDIYWLEREEIAACVEGLEKEQALEDHSARVKERQAYWQRLKQETPPPMMPLKERILGFKTDTFVAQSAASQGDSVLKGVPASPGKVTAPACVLHGPEDFGKMKPGAILVAGTTTPAWTPLFVMAAAVVTDIGGPLSHGSIVAREYGIPAVMGTGVATRRIQDGQRITVDGSAGLVTVTKDKD